MQAAGTNDRWAEMELNPDSEDHKIPRRWIEAAGWVLLVAVLWGSDLFVRFAERPETGASKDDFRLVAEQLTSGIAVLVMIPFVIRWLRIFPLKPGAWIPAIVGHTVGTGIFAAGHYSLMVLMRMLVYGVAGVPYIWREPFFANLFLEYQKDIKIYFGIVAVVIAYRYLTHSRKAGDALPPGGDRLVVQTGTGTAILRYEEIDYLEAARNYVAVHAGGREYLVRDTLSNLVDKLPRSTFLQSHRSYVVNVDQIKEIRSVDSGHRILLRDGGSIPLSRGFRDRFRSALDGE
jgi:hypothetical protein